ncbi:MAG: quinoprotein dehydrogenase-associated SoxYZ-like carrier [Stellaceae bacterium]
MTLRRGFLALLLLGASVLPAAAEMSEAERAARWADLSHALFGDRPVQDAGDALSIDAPDRAENAALVPIALHLAEPLAKNVRTLYLVIDNNPSPLAAVFHFGALADRSAVATRVRVDDYTYLHAVAETADGTLHAAQRFIKASGGCSAPDGNDPSLALARLGKMKLSVAPRLGRATSVQLLISHPNSSGLQMDQLTHTYIPADFIQQIRITAAGAEVLTVDSDIALSEDPSIRFGLLPRARGEIEVDVDDSRQRHFMQRWPLPAATD